jgi:hypothetical protein
MPWRCPACGTHIRQQLITAGEDAPRPGVIYRCGVCHLELVLDISNDSLIAAPVPADTADDKAPRKRSTP